APTGPSARRSEGAPPRDERDEDLQSWGELAILGKLGEGAFGAVYLARDAKLQREVALKLLWTSDASTDPGRALKEARLLARVRHPNVATVYGADQIGGRVGLWMELVKGRTLAELLRTHGPFGAREAALIGLDLCRALAAVHGAGLLHGDIKAHNIMREEGGRTVLMDFGTGKELNLDRRGRTDGPLNDFAGTPLYLAPEVFEGQPCTKATDIYSLGVLLYHLVTDSYPVDGRTREDVQASHRRQERRHLRDIRPDLPGEFVQAVQRALDPNPKHRYHGAGAFESALGRLLGATPEIERGWLTVNVRRIGLTATAVAILLTMGIATYLAVGPPRSGRAAAEGVAATRPVPADAAPAYTIETALYRYRALDGQKVRLHAGSRVEPGDNLFAELRSSVPTYVYIVNQDERGESHMLFPLPGQSLSNPLAPDQPHRLPGTQSGQKDQEVYWVIDKAGGREHFTIFASPTRLDVLEDAFARLPRPELGKPILSARLPPETVSALRSVGGLAPAPASNPPAAGPLTETSGALPLKDTEETTSGVWVRQVSL
ncbi:MAG TPA: serine/threonine-protein kinase, partial [Gemmatimonadales bacterium]|nr:serine/threonine-protein kinase [Gemmatimonadales bacterium]